MIPELHIALLLSSPRTLVLYRSHGGGGAGHQLRPSAEKLRQSVFLDFWQRYPQYPDHVFKNYWEHFLREKQPTKQGWALGAVGRLSDVFLKKSHGRVVVQRDLFGDWQNLLGRISTVPLLAFQLSLFPDQTEAEALIRSDHQHSSLLRPFHPAVEDMIALEGLNETHLHLNGTTNSDLVWQAALARPDKHLQDIEIAFKKYNSVQDLFAELGLTLADLKDQLTFAWDLRETLWKRASLSPRAITKGLRPFERGQWDLNHSNEIRMFMLLWHELNRKNSAPLDRDMHVYILLRNQFHQLLTQRDDQFGFDQFQKFTQTDAREDVEREYYLRLQQLHGSATKPSNITLLEGRYAAKSKAPELWRLIRSILFGYAQYHGVIAEPHETGLSLNDLLKRLKSRGLDPSSTPPKANEKARAFSRMRLTLICHFVKSKPPKEEAEKWTTRYATLRAKIQKQGEVLVSLLGVAPELKHWIRGIDAAANELDAPPEVFGSIFRTLRWAGIRHATYHAGEDFNHLLSGMRAVYESVTFLDLQEGDRIGHATALGLDPQRWVQQMPQKLVVSKQEWLDNLLFLRTGLSNGPLADLTPDRFDDQIAQLCQKIYGEYRDPQRLIAAWKVRWLPPKALAVWLQGDNKYSFSQAPIRQCQWDQVKQAEQEHGQTALKDHSEWLHSPTIKCNGQKFKEIAIDDISVEALFSLQEDMLNLLTRQSIIIESLPTSNLRISAYDRIDEHHMIRWIGVRGNESSSCPMVPVCLGSDDPGIFSTDIANEFYHLFGTLTKQYDLNDQQAIKHLTQVNDRGRIYGFHR